MYCNNRPYWHVALAQIMQDETMGLDKIAAAVVANGWSPIGVPDLKRHISDLLTRNTKYFERVGRGLYKMNRNVNPKRMV